MKVKHLTHRWLLATWIVSLLVSFIPQRTAASSNFTYDTSVTYHVEADSSTTVTEHYSITNNTPRMYLSEIKLSTPTDSLSGLSASYDDGATIPATVSKQSTSKGDIDYNYQQIGIAFPRQLYGQGREWGFTVRYKASGLVDSRGGSHVVFVPSIEPSEGTENYDVRVEVPASFGGAHFAGAKSASGGLSDGYQYYNFARDELVKSSLALSFGDVNLYELNFKFPLNNNSPITRTMTVALPPDLNNQKVYIKKITPTPINTHLDDDGNVLADFRVAAGQHLVVNTDVIGQVRHMDYNLARSGKKADIPADLVKQYTGSTKYWDTGGSVGGAAAKITDPSAPVINNVKTMYQYVIDKLSYNKEKIKFNIRQGSSQALANPTNAVCLEYSDLLIAMLRSQGIPARMPVGYGYSGNLKNSADVADSLHSWVEAYVPGIGWMTLDPTWGEKFDEFGTSDLDHFAFSVWGRNDSSPTAVMAGSDDQNYQYEQAILSYAPVFQPAPIGGIIRVTRFALLPGISLDRIKVTNASQTATDGNRVAIDKDNLILGSLAPSQQTMVNHFVLGASWLSTAKAQYQNEDAMVLASAKAEINYWPMIILVALVIGVAIWLSLRSRKPINTGTDQESTV